MASFMLSMDDGEAGKVGFFPCLPATLLSSSEKLLF